MRAHWPEYAIEAAGLGLFMVSACVFGTLLGHPASPIVAAVPDELARRIVMGVAMGVTAIGLIYSPWGRRSGAHFNPATTLMFWRLGKVDTRDAVAYAIAQTLGGLAGVLVATLLIGPPLGDASVHYVATVPGAPGVVAAFVAEAAMTFVLMSVVLRVSNTASLARFTGLAAAALVATYIAVEAPVSGMSMNPARTFASAVPAGTWTGFWIYLTAPALGMLLAAEAWVRTPGARVLCAKIQHGPGRCIFRCRYGELEAPRETLAQDEARAVQA